nr:NAD(P)-binding protein [Synechococcus sp. A15-60]
MKVVDLAVIGAGLSGCALVAALQRRGWKGSILLLEAGRGPGGRCATRRRREDDRWRLDHGSPTLSFTQAPQGELNDLIAGLQGSDVIRPDDAPVVGVDHLGRQVPSPDHLLLSGPRWRGTPTMATVAEALLAHGGEAVEARFGERITTLRHDGSVWHLTGGHHARALVLSGTLLAHPRSLAMLGWQHVPLREAVAVGFDPQLDAALHQIAGLDASVRWNLMLELPKVSSNHLPRQIWLTAQAQERFGVERLVLHTQQDQRLGLVVHGLDDGAVITPDSQPELLRRHEQQLMEAVSDLVQPWSALSNALAQARSLGVMRWGAAQPLHQGLSADLQWCSEARVGFCGDWIAGQGFGMAEGALQSALNLAERIACFSIAET